MFCIYNPVTFEREFSIMENYKKMTGFKKTINVKESAPKYKKKDAIERAKEYGLDLTLLYENLSRSPTERIENFVRWLKFVDELRKAKPKEEENA